MVEVVLEVEVVNGFLVDIGVVIPIVGLWSEKDRPGLLSGGRPFLVKAILLVEVVVVLEVEVGLDLSTRLLQGGVR